MTNDHRAGKTTLLVRVSRYLNAEKNTDKHDEVGVIKEPPLEGGFAAAQLSLQMYWQLQPLE